MVSQTLVTRLKWLIALRKCSADVTCRMTYRRIEEISSSKNNEPSPVLPEVVDSSGQCHETNRQETFKEDRIEDYTRVRIWTRAAGPILGPYFMPSTRNPIRLKMPYANRQFFQAPIRTSLIYTPAMIGRRPFFQHTPRALTSLHSYRCLDIYPPHHAIPS